MKQKTITKRITAVIVILMMVIGILPAENAYGTSFGNFNVAQKGETAKAATTPANPVYDAATDTTTWSYVYFGSYPQSKVTGENLTAAITGASYDSNGDATVEGVKYRRMKKSDATYSYTLSSYYDWTTGGDADGYHYFKYEPIKWRVLQNDGTDLFLLADQGLDDQQYHTEWESVTWETSKIRSWLNGYGESANKSGNDYAGKKSFINTAFTSAEQVAIADTTVVNNDNPYYGTAGGNDTTDKIFLLSIEEVTNEKYGFYSDYSEYSKSRRMKTSDYGHAMGTWTNTSTEYFGNIWWWLRSPGYYTNFATNVHQHGYVSRWGISVKGYDDAVCPALKIHLSSDLWSSDINTEPTVTETPEPTVTKTAVPTQVPTQSPTKAPTATPKVPKKNKSYTVGNYSYKVTKSVAKNGTVTLQSPKVKTLTKVTIPAMVKINNYTFKVTAIAAKAFQSNKKLETVTIGSNIITIGDNAFAGCTALTKVTVGKNVTTLGKNVFSGDKKLKNIVIQSEKLKKAGTKAFSNIHAKATIKAPKKKLSAYQTLLKGKGQKKTVKIR